MLRDFNIEWLEKRVYIPWNQMDGIMQIVAAGVAFRSQQSATSLATAVASSLIGGLAIAAQNDGVSHGFMAPYDLDINKAIRFRVHFTQTADTGTVSWKVLYAPLIAGTTVIAAPATALDTAVPAYTTALATDNVWLVSDFGQIARKTLLDTTDALMLAITCTDASPNAGLKFLGLEIRYTPRRAAGPRRNVVGARRMLTTRPLGVQLAVAQEGL